MYTSAFDVYVSIPRTINRENWNLLDTFFKLWLILPWVNLIKLFNHLISLIKTTPTISISRSKQKHACYNEGNPRPAHKRESADIQYVPEQSCFGEHGEPNSLSCSWQETVSTREVEGSTIRWDANERIIIRDEITELYPQYLFSLALTLMLPFMLVFYTSSP